MRWIRHGRIRHSEPLARLAGGCVKLDATVPLNWKQSWDPVHRFMSENQYSLPVYADFYRKISTLYGTYKFPETYIINKKGEVAFKVIGSTDWTDPEMLSYLRQLITEPG